jgi:hypothetical protein
MLTVAMSAETTRSNELPLKASVGETCPVPKRAPRERRREARRKVENCDNELIYYLKVEALNQDRTTGLIPLLTGKAKRFLDKFDAADLTWERRYQIIVGAVKAAMLIDPEEESLRQTLKSDDQQEAIAKQHRFLKEGVVGHKGLRLFGLGRDCKIPT